MDNTRIQLGRRGIRAGMVAAAVALVVTGATAWHGLAADPTTRRLVGQVSARQRLRRYRARSPAAGIRTPTSSRSSLRRW